MIRYTFTRAMQNEDLRKEMFATGVKQWEIAEACGISEFHFSRLMRHELPEDLKRAALEAVRDIAAKRKVAE